MGTFEMRFLVPNLNQELQRIPISPVVLSSQRVDMRESLFNASKGEKGQKAQLVNPLVQDGFKLIPPVTRVFRKSADMWVYLQAYEPGVETARPVHAYVTFYQLGAVAATASRLKTIPLSFSFSLGKLDPGEYLCQVTVVDANQRKTAFWQAPIMIVP